MKLLLVSSWFPFPPDNGSKVRAFNLISKLAERHAVTLLSFGRDDEAEFGRPLKEICSEVRTVPGKSFNPQAPFPLRELFSELPRSSAQTYSSTMQGLVDAAVPHHDAAVALELSAALYLAKHSSLPRVFDEAEAGVLRDQYYSQPPGLRRVRQGLTWWKFSHFLRQMTSSFERTTVVSGIELGYLREMSCDLSRIRVVSNGVERDALGRRNAPRPGRLIYPGAVTFSANLDAVRYFVDDIFPLVRASRGDASFIVTGATGDVDLGSFTHRGPVAFTGRVNDVSHLIGQSSVCVVPLRIGGGTRYQDPAGNGPGHTSRDHHERSRGAGSNTRNDILIGDTPSTFAAQVLRRVERLCLASSSLHQRPASRRTALHVGSDRVAARGRSQRGTGGEAWQRARRAEAAGPDQCCEGVSSRHDRQKTNGCADDRCAGDHLPAVCFAHLITPADLVYTGLMFDVPDHAQYWSWITASRKALFISNTMTPEVNDASFMNPMMWLLAGHRRIWICLFQSLFQWWRVAVAVLLIP